MKLEELKKFVADLFSTATDKTTIEKSAVVSEKIDEAIAEQTKQEEDYNKLLHDYKDVVLHSSFKPGKNEIGTNTPGAQADFNPEEFIKSFVDSHDADGSAKNK